MTLFSDNKSYVESVIDGDRVFLLPENKAENTSRLKVSRKLHYCEKGASKAIFTSHLNILSQVPTDSFHNLHFPRYYIPQ